MKIRLLGNVAIGDETLRPIKARNTRICIAYLAQNACRPVPSNILITEIWPEDPPRSPENALQATVKRTREFLEKNGGARDMLSTVPGGYILEVHRDDVDALRFETEVKSIIGSPTVSVARCQEALNAWSGPALMDASDGPRCHNAATRLEDLRMDLLEQISRRRLAEGDFVGAAHDTAQLVHSRPFHESYRILRMLSLAHIGRSADALRQFWDFSAALGDDMGMAPSDRARRIYELILTNADGELARACGPSTESPLRSVV